MLGFAPSRDLSYRVPHPLPALASQPKWGVPPAPNAAAPKQAGFERCGACETCCDRDSPLIPALGREEKSFTVFSLVWYLWLPRTHECVGAQHL